MSDLRWIQNEQQAEDEIADELHALQYMNNVISYLRYAIGKTENGCLSDDSKGLLVQALEHIEQYRMDRFGKHIDWKSVETKIRDDLFKTIDEHDNQRG